MYLSAEPTSSEKCIIFSALISVLKKGNCKHKMNTLSLGGFLVILCNEQLTTKPNDLCGYIVLMLS